MSQTSCGFRMVPVVECMRKPSGSVEEQKQRTQYCDQAISLSSLRLTQEAMSSRRDTPHFIFIDPQPSQYENSLCNAWNRAVAEYFPSDANPPFSVYEGKLNQLDAGLLQCDCIVSPANSYGIMDGGCAPTLSK